ncbi:MAG TPA: FG-GAP-like repeat-containing protein, partial [Chitinophagaceae bacterium]
MNQFSSSRSLICLLAFVLIKATSTHSKSLYKKICFFFLILIFPFISSGQAPAILLFAPTSGPAGTTVTINGTGFNPVASQNVVFFGTMRATVVSASTNILTVTVPASATHDYLSVVNLESKLIGYSSIPFDVTFPGKLNFFTQPSNFVGTLPTAVSIADIDGDGKNDMAVVFDAANKVVVYRNITSANGMNFDPIDVFTGDNLSTILTGDFDGDGKMDIAAMGAASMSIYIVRNTSTPGTISFGPAVSLALGT